MSPNIAAVDIGGTFTDLVFYDAVTGTVRTAKQLTTPQELTEGAFAALEAADVTMPELQYLKHGTTTAINTVIEHTGATAALITTAGFRDVLESGRGNRPLAFDLSFRRMAPLVPRSRRLEISARVDGEGRELVPVKIAELEQLAAEMERLGVSAVAVSLLHAYRAPGHEQEIGAWLREHTDLFVSLSHELSREWREFERTSTAVVNAYVGPRMDRYLRRFEEALDHAGFPGTFFVMESNGGVLTGGSAREAPVKLLESGPVAGVVGAAALSQQLGHRKAISFDMGGTTAKCALIEDGAFDAASVYYVGGYERGYAVQVPVVDIIEVGAGGGSIAWIDEAGSLKVGPRSAGAEPGPVCYGRGGTAPTVTDANLALGRLDDRGLLGGRFPLNRDAAAAAIQHEIADPLGLSVTEAAEGIIRLAVVIMATAVRRVSLERGYDPRDFVLVSSGGAGPLHTVEIARELGIPIVIVPPLPGHFSAWGMLLADVRHDYARTFVSTLTKLDLGVLERAFQELETQARATLAEEVPDLRQVTFEREADVRYVGQEHTVRTVLPERLEGDGVLDRIREDFRARYSRRYGRVDLRADLEFVAIRLAAVAHVDKPRITSDGLYADVPEGERAGRTYFAGAGWTDAKVYDRASLDPGAGLRGPVVVSEPGSTTIVGPGDRLTVDEGGSLVIELGQRDASQQGDRTTVQVDV